MKKDWTEIVNLAGQMHNLHQDPYMPLDEAYENEMARKILLELGLDIDGVLGMVGEIESALYDDARDDDTVLERIDRACRDLRYKITNVIGE